MDFEAIYAVEIEGVAPLLQHRYTKDSKSGAKSAGRGATVYDPQEEAEKGLYQTKDGNPYEPADHLEAAFIKEAVNYKIPGQGKKTFKDAIRAGVIIEPREIPISPGTWEIDERVVVIKGDRILRWRPRFNEWNLKFEIQVIDERITENILKEIVINAGKYVGIGDFRPKFGRYQVLKFAKVK